MSADLEKMSVQELQATRQYDELGKRINAVSAEMRECYSIFGGLEQLLTPPVGISRKIDLASAAGDAYRARAQFERDTRARETRKEKLSAQQAREQEIIRIAGEQQAREEEVKLSAHYRTLWPSMSDSAWADVWPSVRADHYTREKAARLEAINKGIGYEQF
jgi:hypothetical protein